MREFYIHTNDWAVCKFRHNGRRKSWEGDVCRARPGSTKIEAWANACEATRCTKKEFLDAGWDCQRLIITGHQ